MHHDRQFDPCYGAATEVFAGVRRLTARNPSPFTFHGTNTYLIGQRSIAVIDPGPADEQHVNDIIRACEGATIEAIVVSHTHIDHSPAAALLRQRTGAPIWGCAPHRPARSSQTHKGVNPMDASSDKAYRADTELKDGMTLKAAGAQFLSLETPGHTDNHLCFALEGTDCLFSADHVMAWSTSIVAPPDGNMTDYMNSLDRLMERPESMHLPGHGGPINRAHAYMNQLKQHRLAREAAILKQLGNTPSSIPDIVLQIYEGLDPALRGAAALSVFAHLEDLSQRGVVVAAPELRLDASYSLCP